MMKRLLIAFLLLASSAQAQEKAIAVTFDDLPLNGIQFELPRLEKMTTKLVASITEAGVPAVGFVNEVQIYKEGEVDRRIALLKQWHQAGLELGNHTYSHPSLQTTPLSEFQDDFVRGDTILRAFFRRDGRAPRYFRHPYLRTGATPEVKAEFEQFLKSRGYTIAPVTIENSDYMFNLIYTIASTKGDTAQMKRVGAHYLAYTEQMLEYFEGLSQEALGYQVKHILLLHANELNADYFGELVKMLRRHNYRFITLEEALTDKAYKIEDKYVGERGMSWLHRWMYSRKQPDRHKDEPDPPQEILKTYNELQNE